MFKRRVLKENSPEVAHIRWSSATFSLVEFDERIPKDIRERQDWKISHCPGNGRCPVPSSMSSASRNERNLQQSSHEMKNCSILLKWQLEILICYCWDLPLILLLCTHLTTRKKLKCFLFSSITRFKYVFEILERVSINTKIRLMQTTSD